MTLLYLDGSARLEGTESYRRLTELFNLEVKPDIVTRVSNIFTTYDLQMPELDLNTPATPELNAGVLKREKIPQLSNAQ